MKVHELITKLAALDPQAEVILFAAGREGWPTKVLDVMDGNSEHMTSPAVYINFDPGFMLADIVVDEEGNIMWDPEAEMNEV